MTVFRAVFAVLLLTAPAYADDFDKELDAMFGPGSTFEFAKNSYAVQGQLQLALSDYLLRYPKLIDAARLGTEAARVGKRISEVDAAQEARVAYYEWVR